MHSIIFQRQIVYNLTNWHQLFIRLSCYWSWISSLHFAVIVLLFPVNSDTNNFLPPSEQRFWCREFVSNQSRGTLKCTTRGHFFVMTFSFATCLSSLSCRMRLKKPLRICPLRIWVESNSVCYHKNDNKIGRPRSGSPISLSRVWLETELDDMKSYYQLIIRVTISEKKIADLWRKRKIYIKKNWQRRCKHFMATAPPTGN